MTDNTLRGKFMRYFITGGQYEHIFLHLTLSVILHPVLHINAEFLSDKTVEKYFYNFMCDLYSLYMPKLNKL